jgi:hypothetical protein
MSWFRQQKRVTANAIDFDGEGVYQIALPELHHGLVFEDNGKTGYLYVTDETFAKIHDTVHIYDHGDPNQLKKGQRAFIVWSAELKKAGLYFNDMFHAGVDFAGRETRSRSGFPPNSTAPWSSDHRWRESIIEGLEP